jgi:hypothetical protein
VLRRRRAGRRYRRPPRTEPPTGQSRTEHLGIRPIPEAASKHMPVQSMPFDVKRMVYGGFKVLVNA